MANTIKKPEAKTATTVDKSIAKPVEKSDVKVVPDAPLVETTKPFNTGGDVMGVVPPDERHDVYPSGNANIDQLQAREAKK